MSNHLQMQIQRQHILLSHFKDGSPTLYQLSYPVGGYHVTLCAVKRIARRDFHFFLCHFVAVSLEINKILDQLIIQLVWYVLKQLFTSVSVKAVDIYLHFGE